jgi:hypothetical protein
MKMPGPPVALMVPLFEIAPLKVPTEPNGLAAMPVVAVIEPALLIPLVMAVLEEMPIP